MATLTKTDVSRNLMRDSWRGVDTSHIRYVAIGNVNTAPSSGDTKLANEVFRKAVTSYTVGATGELFINFYIAPNEAVGQNIAEVGVFAGLSASSTKDSGVLIGRGLYTHAHKLNTESITIQIDGNIA